VTPTRVRRPQVGRPARDGESGLAPRKVRLPPELVGARGCRESHPGAV